MGHYLQLALKAKITKPKPVAHQLDEDVTPATPSLADTSPPGETWDEFVCRVLTETTGQTWRATTPAALVDDDHRRFSLPPTWMLKLARTSGKTGCVTASSGAGARGRQTEARRFA